MGVPHSKSGRIFDSSSYKRLSRSMPILVVEDMTGMRGLLSWAFLELGFKNVYTADTVERGLNALNRTSFDLIFSDTSLEGVSGLDFLKLIRSSKRHANMPFVLVSSDSNIEQIKLARSERVTAYILKPVHAESLLRCLEDIFEGVIVG